MKVKVEVMDLTHRQWIMLQVSTSPDYQFTTGDIRVCAVFTRGGEERHVEIPHPFLYCLLDELSKADDGFDQTAPGG
jgi:hypothetical protein